MANLNVNRSVTDAFYRYKMPRLIAKVKISLLNYYQIADFYPFGASDAQVIAIIVCLFVCVTHAGIVSKRLQTFREIHKLAWVLSMHYQW